MRKVSYGVGVERIFPVQSPNVTKLEIKSRGFVRRSRLYYLRDLTGKQWLDVVRLKAGLWRERFTVTRQQAEAAQELPLQQVEKTLHEAEDERTPDPFAVAAETARCEEVARALSMLDEREGRVLMMRYGIGGESPRTLSDVGAALGITRERVRQIENRALSKLRDPGAVLDLRSLL